jgi:hypothetical protein
MSQPPNAAPRTEGRIFDTDWSVANVARLLRANAGRGTWRHAATTGGSTGSVNQYYLRTVSARHLPSGVSHLHAAGRGEMLVSVAVLRRGR